MTRTTNKFVSMGVISVLGFFSLLVAPPAIAEPSNSEISVKAPLSDTLEEDTVWGFLVDSRSLAPAVSRLEFSTGSRFHKVLLRWGKGFLGEFRSIDLALSVTKSEAELMAKELSSRLGVNVVPQVTYRKAIDVGDSGEISTSAIQSGATWGLDRIDQRSLPLDSEYEYFTEGTGVTAYVVDTGILGTHNEFAGRMAPGFSSISDGMGTVDCDGHGTHVAGTIGGTQYGVAKNVTLVPVRVLDCDGSGTDATVIAGIEWVIANHTSGPAVMNLSLGGGYSAALNSAVRRAYEDGIVVVVASGNEGDDACNYSPSSEPTAITVNASTRLDDDASFSNFGSCTDIYAPGQDIRSAFIGGTSQVANLSGTSMASPHVAGAAALILERSPDLTPAQVWSEISSAGTDIDWYWTEADAKILLYTGSILPTFENIPSIEVSGTPAIGETLTGSPGDWSSSCDCTPDLSYQWLRNGNPISGETSIEYLIQDSDNGARLSFQVTASSDGFQSATAVSAQTGRVAAGFAQTSNPTITGNPTSGQTLRVTTGSWSPRPRFTYQWNCDGEPISRATRSSLRLSRSQDDCMISVTVTASARNVVTTTRTSDPVGPVGTQFTAAPLPTINGNAGYDNLLTSDIGSWSPTPTTLSYQWHYGNGSEIAGATESSYLVTEADYGNSIHLCVTGVRSGYVNTVRCSSETDVVLGYALTLTPTPEISGVVGIGNTVTAVPGTWDAGVSLSYQWMRNGQAIPDAVFEEYDITEQDWGSYLSVVVTGSLEGYSPSSRVSSSVGEIAYAFLRSPNPTISGTLRERSTLRVSAGSWSPRPRLSYQWYRDGVPINRATRTSYRLTSSDVGSSITVSVTATARGYTTTTRYSSETGIIAARR